MQRRHLTIRDYGVSAAADSRLRLQTIMRLRWMAIVGQSAAIAIVWLGLGFDLPVGLCVGLIALSAWLNVFLAIRYPARHRLSTPYATGLLAYDILQLAALLYLTGGIENPFTMLIVAPVTVSAATLPLRSTVPLGIIAILSACFLTFYHEPLPWYAGAEFVLPYTYRIGALVAVAASLTFLALYVWRISKEARQMTAALAATDLVLAREQRLHAIDGLAAAAAHELGTPLSTIVVVAKELERELATDGTHTEDIALLMSQAQRCRDILQRLTRQPSEQDPVHAHLSVRQMLDEAARPYRAIGPALEFWAGPSAEAVDAAAREPEAERRPGVIYGLGNIIENAVDFARHKVEVRATWNASAVEVTIADDGPGFPQELMDQIGEPYVTTRPSAAQTQEGDATGLGLGVFIARTLLERSGATIIFENRRAPASGAVVRIVWPRSEFEGSMPSTFLARPGQDAATAAASH